MSNDELAVNIVYCCDFQLVELGAANSTFFSCSVGHILMGPAEEMEEKKESKKCIPAIQYIKSTSMTASEDRDAIFSSF